jgi:hypothetical protein
MGKWKEDEKALFQQGIADFGLDWRKMEEFMGGARSLEQIRTYYRSMKEKYPDMFSPEKVGKKTPTKRSSAAAGNISTTTRTKKTKAGEELSKTPTKRTPKRAPALATTAVTSVTTRARSNLLASAAHSRVEDEFDEMPPLLPPSVGKKAVIKKNVPTDAAKKTSSSGSDAVAAREVVDGSAPIKSITDFLEMEEVQTVLAGILGFLVVLVAKQWMK